MADDASEGFAATFLAGGGEMGARTRAFDWARAPIGAPEGWSASLRTTVGTVLNARHPMLLMWGPELIQFYNDAFSVALAADRHPAALGARGRVFWRDAWPMVGPQIEAVLERAEATWQQERLVPIIRNGRMEEVYWTYSYSPVRGDDGQVAGVLVVCQDDTARALDRRRRRVRSDLAHRATLGGAPKDPWSHAVEALARDQHDLPWVRLYRAEDGGNRIQLVEQNAPLHTRGDAPGDGRALDDGWPLGRVIGTGEPCRLDLDKTFGQRVVPPWPEPVEQVYLAPIRSAGDATSYGVLAVGLSPRLPFDEGYVEFLREVADLIAAAIDRDRVEAEQRRSAAALAAASARFRELFEQAPIGVAVMSGPEHRFTVANPVYLSLTRRDRIVGMTYADAFPELADTALPSILDRVYATGEPFVAQEYRVVLEDRSDGDGGLAEGFFRFHIAPIRDATEQVTALIIIAVEVTDHVHGRRAVQQAQDRLTFALSAAGVGYWDLDLETRVAQRSLRHDHIFGYPEGAPDWTLERFIEHVVPADRARVARSFSRAVEAGEDWNVECDIIGADGGHRSVEAYGRLERDGDDAPTRMLGVVRDVTERRDLLTREQQARTQAEQANRAKDEFLAMLGHELRNPLAPILTALQLMRLRGVEAAQRERAVIERQARHLVALVDDLLDVSRITRGKIQLKRRRVQLGEVVARAIEMASPLLEQHQHHLEIEVPSDGLALDCDPHRLAQVVANLLTNAAKYTESGGRITVSARRIGDELIVDVRDTGIGIAPDMLPRVFDLFSQERQAIDRAEGGLGLGLAIVRSLTTLHGGSVTADSAGIGHGATFTVRLPAAPVGSDAAGAGAEPDAQGGQPRATGIRVLVVDDNADAAALIADSLAAMGHDTCVAHDGAEGLRLARATLPDVAVIDIGLPLMDGYELARQLRATDELRDVRIIAVTGYGQAQDRERSMAAGFAAHLVKPVDLAALHAHVCGNGTTPG